MFALKQNLHMKNANMHIGEKATYFADDNE